MAVLTVATLGLTIFLAFVVPKGLFPQQDTGLISGFSEAAQDISSGAMQRSQAMVNRIVHDDPDVEHVLSFVGGAQGAGNTGTVFVALRPHDKRKSTADEIVGRLRPKLSSVPGITLFLQSVQDMRVGGRASRTQFQYALQDADLAELATWSPKVLERLRKVPELRDVNTDQQTAGIQLDVVIDRDRAARQGISIQTIDDTLVRRLWPAPGRDVVHAAQLLPRRAGGDAGPAGQPRSALARLPAGVGRRAGPAVEHREVRHLRRPAVDQPPGPAARDDAIVQPGAGRRARSGRHRDPRRRAPDRPAGHGARRAFKARRRPSAPRSAASRG